jgi:antitoxin (DNA-binding transcriptional repressor) of toxin-antitoxin stability system
VKAHYRTAEGWQSTLLLNAAVLWQTPRMTTVTLEKAQNDLPCLVARALAGEEIVIAADGVAAVKLAPISTLPVFDEATARARGYGSMKGQFDVPDSFFEPLPDDELALWEGSRDP